MIYRGLWVIAPLFWTLLVHAEESADYRLPPGIAPSSQSIELRIDPASPFFSGSTRIELVVEETVPRIGLYQQGLTLGRILLSTDGRRRELQAADGEWDHTWLADGKPITRGRYVLELDFEGTFATDSLGMHRVRFEERDYVFTQFEVMHARRAFPVFDEPAFKIPYRLAVRAPAGLTVVSNTPVEERSESEGWQHVRFMQTPPLPSYLLALAVGPLDRAPLDGMSVPGFIYTPSGRAGEVGFVQRYTPAILKALESYFGAPYHYRKLDFVAVPEFAFGAMENPGLVTYRTDLLMVGDEVSGATAATVLSIIAHELAHQWYGDLVTMQWWDDLWLNEAFASWMGGKVMASVFPQYETELQLPQSAAFPADQLLSAKAIRKPVRTEDDAIEDLGLNYSKGEAILRMMEAYAGEAEFRDAIRDYLKRHAWGNARAAELWDAIGDRAGREIVDIADDYINQAGLPMVSIERDGRISQARYASLDRVPPPRQWRIPLDIKYKHQGQVKRLTYLLDDEDGKLKLPRDTEWVFPDAGANGYYRWKTDPEWFQRLLQDSDVLSEREKIALLDNSQGLLEAGQLDIQSYLAAVQIGLADPHPMVALPAIEAMLDVGNRLVDADTSEAFAGFVDRTLGVRIDGVGLEPRQDDNEAIRQMRPRLLRLQGQYGSDPVVRKAIDAITDRYLSDPANVPTDLAREALRVSALHGDAKLYQRYITSYRSSKSEDQKSTLLSSMYFRDSELVRQRLNFFITDAVPAGDATLGLAGAAFILQDHAPIYAWLEENLAALEAKLPSYVPPLLPLGMQNACNDANLALLREFFEPRGEKYAASLEKATETIEDCIRKKAREGEGLRAFLGQP
ncbi:MAG: M1 family metallopeptidase [Chromatiales bacterium]|nr:M1 family metallopeptidase [Chromatiales bacterium]